METTRTAAPIGFDEMRHTSEKPSPDAGAARVAARQWRRRRGWRRGSDVEGEGVVFFKAVARHLRVCDGGALGPEPRLGVLGWRMVVRDVWRRGRRRPPVAAQPRRPPCRGSEDVPGFYR
ncbi:hypothetical protein ACP70R_013306 [Stipagrostis hirtigluma subsp. patula]